MNGNESAPVLLARWTLEQFLTDRTYPKVGEDLRRDSFFQQRAGVFVSLKRAGRLRGCIGTFMPEQGDLVREIMVNAVRAATEDPRFYPVGREEVDELTISVDVLSEPEPVGMLSELDPKRYGVIMVAGRRRSLLLPDLEGVETVEEQLVILRQKGNIAEEETVALFRFTVSRYG